MPSTDSDAAPFTSVDWQQTATGTRLRAVRARTVGLAAALLALAALFAYDFVVAPGSLVAGWDVSRVGWLFLFAGVVVVRYAIVPLVVDWDRTNTYVREFCRHPVGVLSFAYLAGFAVLGVLGPEWFGLARAEIPHRLQPPVFASFDPELVYGYECVGDLAGGRCQGSWQYPLGTTRVGEDVGKLIMYAMHIGLKLGVAAGVLMVVAGTAVGTTAGYFGGWVDDVLMGVVDVMQTIPAIVVYLIVAMMYLDDGLFTLALVFGLFDWGGIARLVRSETIQRRQSGYVLAARSAGASHLRVVRKHVLPNASSTVVTSLSRQIPMLVLIQVALSYLKLNSVNVRSLGEVLRRGLSGQYVAWHQKWWIVTFVVAFLVVTVVAFNLFGDAVSDVLDPEGGGA